MVVFSGWRRSPLTAPKPVAPKRNTAPTMRGWPSSDMLNRQNTSDRARPLANRPRPATTTRKPRGATFPTQSKWTQGILNRIKPQQSGPMPGNGQPHLGNFDGRPDINDFLGGDPTFNDQMSLFQKLREDFELSNASQRGDVEEDFATALERLGLQRKRSHRDMTGDFASRGLLHSGLFTGELAEYDEDYTNVISDLGRDKQRTLEDLIESLGMFQTQLDAQQVGARQEALRRYAERFATMPDGSPAPNPDVNPLNPDTSPNPKPQPKPQQKPINLQNFGRIANMAINKDMGAKQIRERLGTLTPNQRRALQRAIAINKNRPKATFTPK